MRSPIRTEAEAFRFVLVAGAIGIVVAVVGVLANGWAALGVFLALSGAALWVLRGRPEGPEPAWWVRERVGRTRATRLLVLANETLAGEALLAEIRRRAAQPGAEVRVVVPALNSRVRHWTSDVDAAHAAAQARLDESLRRLDAVGIRALGAVGDDDPVQALEDALRDFPATEVIVSTHPPGRSNWLERGVVERARERYPLPIAHVVVDLASDRATVTAEV
jgi:GABA permease